LKTEGVCKSFGGGKSWFGFGKPNREVKAVQNVQIELRRGETLGVVGESGSGKSTLARCVIRLIDSDEGQIKLGDVDITKLSRNDLRPYRKRIQMVFQDPFASLNPRIRVGDIISQGPILQGEDKEDASKRAYELLDIVGLDRRSFDRFPHEFSGGQRQRIGIARALSLKPDILVADEPVSALDVSIQAQILELLDDIREQMDLSMLFITHDLRVAAQVCDYVAVMQYGKIVEMGPTAKLFKNPKDAYTKSLLAAVPGKDWHFGKLKP
jgi:peptide/nickel transport system ATP-binding protein